MDIVPLTLNGKVDHNADEIGQLTRAVCNQYWTLPNVIDIPGENVFFVGDLHGELDSIQRVLQVFLKYKDHSLVFLGDYGDRGPSQVETFNLAMAMTLQYPERVFMLRGNHESESIAMRYGFHAAVLRKHSEAVFSDYVEVFKALPMAAISPSGIFACHGGVPEKGRRIDDLQTPDRHQADIRDEVLFQLIWNDPVDANFGFSNNMRGTNIRSFGKTAFERFKQDFGVSMMIRAHEAFREGIQTFFDGELISLFSASYGGSTEPKFIRMGKEFKYEIFPIK
jgi:predicted phosphodiesterase